jgi:serine protease
MFKKVLFATALSLSLLSSPYASEPGTKETPQLTPCAPGVVYVKLKEGSKALGQIASQKDENVQSIGGSSFQQVLSKLDVNEIVQFDPNAAKSTVSRSFGIDRMYCVYYSNQTIDPHAAVDMFDATGEVECGSARYLFPVSMQPNDPKLSQQYAYTNTGMFNAWNTTIGDSTVLIGVVDDGFNVDHEDLKDAIVAQYDVVGDIVSGQRLKPDSDARPDSSINWHGSFTSGCIAATGNNNVGIAGSAYGCRLVVIKAAGRDNLITGGYEGIQYANDYGNGVQVINCSWGGGVAFNDTAYANTFIEESLANNTLFVAGAGNSHLDNDAALGYELYPPNVPGVLSVGATNKNDSAWVSSGEGSDYGHSVSVWAPGVNVLGIGYPGTSAYFIGTGTSFASPLTAGLGALIISLHPDWSVDAVKQQIIQTCDNVVNPADQYNYWGRINADKAINTSEAVSTPLKLDAGIMSLQNSPNPFQNSTTVYFTLTKREFVRVSVYDALGRPVAVLHNAVTDAGLQTAAFYTTGLMPGVYYCMLETEDGTRLTHTMTVMK